LPHDAVDTHASCLGLYQWQLASSLCVCLVYQWQCQFAAAAGDDDDDDDKVAKVAGVAENARLENAELENPAPNHDATQNP